MKAINPYLNFNGNCREAMTFYSKAVGGELIMQSYSDAGMSKPGVEDRVIHARLSSGGAATVIMASDTPADQPATFGDNNWVCVDCDDNDEQDRMFKALSDGGIVVMPLDVMFWGARFGMLKDKFGVCWMFNAEQKK
jgi:PhnB protein